MPFSSSSSSFLDVKLMREAERQGFKNTLLLEQVLSSLPGPKFHVSFAVTPLDCYQHGSSIAEPQAALKMADS